MAVAFDAVGPSSAGTAFTTGPGTWTHVNGGNGILVGVTTFTGSSNVVTSVTYGGVTVPLKGFIPANNGTAGGVALYGLVGGACPTGSNTVSVAVSDANNHNAGSVSVTGASSLGTVVTAFAGGLVNGLSAAFGSTTTGGLIVSAACQGSGTAASATSPNVKRLEKLTSANSGADNIAMGTDPSTGGAVSPAWTIAGTDFWGIVAVEVLPAAVAVPFTGSPPPLPPGWFPGSAAVTQDPGGIPFYPEPAPADATPAVIIPPTPEAAPVRPLPPGWFPGADRVTSGPGAVPFQPQPVPLTATPPVIFPVPEVAGIVDYLPLPPGYFPGSQTVTVDPGGIPFYSQPQPLNPPPAPAAPPVISGLAGGGTGYFTDQYGQPRFLLADNPWGLIPNAGRWGGTWQSDIDTYCGNRGGQGFTAIYLDPLGNAENGGVFGDGRTQDGVFPFTVNGSAASTASLSGSETIGLNAVFWARVDYFLQACARNGMTALLNVGYYGPGDFASGAALTTMTSAQSGQYGAALGGRYATVANIIWIVGNDYFGGTGGTIGSGGGSPAGNDTVYSSLLTGLRGGGDTHVISIHNFVESDSRQALGSGDIGTAQYWGNNFAQFSGAYTYNVTYLAIEDAYGEANPVPVMLLDGYFYQGTSTYSTAPAYDRAFRQDTWHAISSGARGVSQGSESIWQWGSTSLASSGTDWFHVHNAGNIRTLVESLPNWHKLIPDTSSVLVTSGRGTRHARFTSGGGGGQYEPAFTDSFVSASRTAAGDLAVIYLSHATTITIDQSKMVAGYAAWWVDPITGAKTSTTASSTYNSATPGNNSQGDPDWVLVLQGTATTAALPAPGLPDWQPQPPGWFPGADKVTDLPGGIPFYVVPQPADQVAGPAAGVAANVTGVAAPVTVASPAGVPLGSANVAGTAAAITAAAPAGVPAGSAGVPGAAAPVTAASPAGVLAASAGTTGVAAPVTVASPAGVPASAANITGTAALITVSGAAGTAFGGTSGAANVTGSAAQVTVTAPAGTPSAAAAITGTAAHVTTAAPAGVPAGSGNVTGLAAHVTAAAPAGSLSAGNAITGIAAHVTVAAPAGVAASAAAIVNATSAPALTTRTTSLAAAGAVTSSAPAVTSKAGSSPAVTDG